MAQEPLSLTVRPEPKSVGSFKSQSMRSGPMAAEMAGTEGSFSDALDVINPLQHIPVVSSIYRAFTGDTISTPAKILGGTLFGGPIGFVASLFSTIFEKTVVADMAGRAAGTATAAASNTAASGYQAAQQLGGQHTTALDTKA